MQLHYTIQMEATFFSRLCIEIAIISSLIVIPVYASQGTQLSSQVKCPLTCKCEKIPAYNMTQWKVTCVKEATWSAIPPLPENTTSLVFLHQDIQVLQDDLFSKKIGTSLKTLHLRYSNIASISSGTFNKLFQLEILRLSGNEISSLPLGVFKALTQLVTLDLSRNQLHTIPAKQICVLQHLEALYLSSNKLNNGRFDKCFIRLNKLHYLDMSDNPLGEMEPEDFTSLRNIIKLLLNDASLKRLPPGIFKYMPLLRFLYLGRNKLTHLDNSIFNHLPMLSELQIFSNKLETVPAAALSELKSLSILNIEHNNIKSNILGSGFTIYFRELSLSRNPIVTLSNESFLSLKNAQYFHKLTLLACRLKEIEADAFLPISSLQELYLNENPLNAKMMEQAFYGLRFVKNMTMLNLRFTNLRDLSNNTFQFLINTSLHTLSMTTSKIHVLQSGTFSYLPMLRVLMLNGNWIQQVQPDTFLVLKVLTEINLSGNRLVFIPNNANAVPLEVLNLDHNLISNTLTSNALEGYRQLVKLNLNRNSLEKITETAFQHTSNLQILRLSNNNIVSLRKYTFYGLKNLEYLYLENNKIQWIEANTFVETIRLETMDLSNNPEIAGWNEKIDRVLAPLQNLKELTLRATGLQDLPESTFYHLPKLGVISLGDNQLSQWHSGLFANQTKLKRLVLGGNQLTTVHRYNLEMLTSLEELDISGNAFACNCELLWFTNWIRTGTVYINDIDELTCRFPNERRGDHLVNIHMEKECMSMTIYYIYWSILVSNVLLITLMAVLYRMRWYIK